MGNCCSNWFGFACCAEAKEGKPVAGLAEYSQRSCTDVLFLAAFIASWIAIFAILISAIEKGGDPQIIIKPVDYKGQVCGEGVQSGKKYAFWPDVRDAYQFKDCVESCDKTNDPTFMNAHGKQYEILGFKSNYASVNVVFYCIPSLKNLVNGSISFQVTLDGDFQSASEDASRAVGDLYTAWPVILVSAFCALLVSFIYMYLTEKCAGLMVWGGIILIAGAGFIFAYVMFDRANEYEDTQLDNRSKVMKGLGYSFAIGTALFIIIVICLRERINIAIEVVKEAAKAIQDMKGLLLFPLFPFAIAVGYFVFFISVALYIFSVGEFKDKPTPASIVALSAYSSVTTFKDFEWDQDLKNSFAYHFFHGLWNIQFLIYFAYLVTAGAIAEWYFTPYDESGRKPRGTGANNLSNSPVCASACRTIRFHLGTVAVASLIIAIIQFIRATVKYIEEKSKAAQGEPNRLQKCLFCAIHCCLWCLECCMDKINKNALIWTAIWGDGFAVSVCSSFQLIWNNLARIAAVNLVGSYLILLGKIFVAMATAGICGLAMISIDKYKTELSSIAMPCFVIFLLAFLVSSLFMVIYETTIDTVFLCFLVDEAHNKGGHMLASKDLQAIVDKYADLSLKKSETMKSQTFERQKTLGRQPASTAPPSEAATY